MLKPILGREQGQSIVVIALLIVGLVAMLGLVIDGGNAYLQRRRMQNAADAGALAGARTLGMGSNHSAQMECAIRQSIETYAKLNETPGPSPDPTCHSLNSNVKAYFVDKTGAQVGVEVGLNGGVPGQATGVSVRTQISFATFFLGVVNESLGSAAAGAAAMTGPAGSVVGLVPWALNWDAAGAPLGERVSLGSSTGSGGTYNYESINTDQEGLGNFRNAMCQGIRQGVAISPRRYQAILSSRFTPDERDCLQQRLTARPSETWDHFASDSPRVMLLPVLDGTAGEGYVNVKAFRAFFLEAVDTRNSLAYGRFVRLIVTHATLDFSAPNTGVWVVKLTR
jgi:Flp pilus assembly protein TadG